jgi:hypothetical protein
MANGKFHPSSTQEDFLYRISPVIYFPFSFDVSNSTQKVTHRGNKHMYMYTLVISKCIICFIKWKPVWHFDVTKKMCVPPERRWTWNSRKGVGKVPGVIAEGDS